MLARFDPFQEIGGLLGARAAARALPLDVYRREDGYVVQLDVPGVDPGGIDVTLERGVLHVGVERGPGYGDGDRVLVAERPHGRLTRQVHLGTDVDGDGIVAECRDGVLTIRAPIGDAVRPRRIEIGGGERRTLEAQTA